MDATELRGELLRLERAGEIGIEFDNMSLRFEVREQAADTEVRCCLVTRCCTMRLLIMFGAGQFVFHPRVCGGH
jgi:hypothetical protein